MSTEEANEALADIDAVIDLEEIEQIEDKKVDCMVITYHNG